MIPDARSPDQRTDGFSRPEATIGTYESWVHRQGDGASAPIVEARNQGSRLMVWTTVALVCTVIASMCAGVLIGIGALTAAPFEPEVQQQGASILAQIAASSTGHELDAAERTRAVGVAFGFITAATLLIGAIAAFFAAAAAGRHRHENSGFGNFTARH